MSAQSLTVSALGAVALLLSLATVAAADDPAPMATQGAERIKGYLERSELPDSLALLPPPPELGSAAEALDMHIARQAQKFEGEARFKLAALDADLSSPLCRRGLFLRNRRRDHEGNGADGLRAIAEDNGRRRRCHRGGEEPLPPRPPFYA